MEDQPSEDPSLLTVPQAAEEAQLSQMAVRSAITRGRLPATELYGRLLIRRSDFITWMATKKRGRPFKDKGAKAAAEEEGGE